MTSAPYFDDDGRPVAAVEPTYPGDDVDATHEDSGARVDRLDVLHRFVEWLASDNADAVRAGRRALAVARLLKIDDSLATQRQLAERSGCSLGAVNKAARETLPAIKALVRQSGSVVNKGHTDEGTYP